MSPLLSIDVRSLINDELDAVKVRGRWRLSRKRVLIRCEDAPDHVMGTFRVTDSVSIVWVALLDGEFQGEAEYNVEAVDFS